MIKTRFKCELDIRVLVPFPSWVCSTSFYQLSSSRNSMWCGRGSSFLWLFGSTLPILVMFHSYHPFLFRSFLAQRPKSFKYWTWLLKLQRPILPSVPILSAARSVASLSVLSARRPRSRLTFLLSAHRNVSKLFGPFTSWLTTSLRMPTPKSSPKKRVPLPNHSPCGLIHFYCWMVFCL